MSSVDNSNMMLGCKEAVRGTSLMGQWLRLCAPNAGGLGSIPGQGTIAHMLQLRVHMPQLKIPRATAQTCFGQINKYLKTNKQNKK